MTDKERFIQILSKVKRNGIDRLITWLEESTFFTDPASASYHDNFVGGLCKHSLDVYDNYVHLTGTDYEDETAIITCLLHDICKAGSYKIIQKRVKNEETNKWETANQYGYADNIFPYGHGEKSVLMINRFIGLTKEEMLMIRWHMGAYESKECWKDLGDAQKMYKSVMFIHFADMLASKGYVYNKEGYNYNEIQYGQISSS